MKKKLLYRCIFWEWAPFSSWEKVLMVRASSIEEALYKCAKKLHYDGFWRDDNLRGDFYRNVSGGMSFRSGSCSCRYDVEEM